MKIVRKINTDSVITEGNIEPQGRNRDLSTNLTVNTTRVKRTKGSFGMKDSPSQCQTYKGNILPKTNIEKFLKSHQLFSPPPKARNKLLVSIPEKF
jgi:hypothetical protein